VNQVTIRSKLAHYVSLRPGREYNQHEEHHVEEPDMTVSEQTFRQVALEDPEGHWELHCGVLHRKPGMTSEHNNVAGEVFYALRRQLDSSQFRVRLNLGHVHISVQNYYIPDVFVVPVALQRPLLGTRKLEAYDAPLPLVVEVWSPSTGQFDVEMKLVGYQGRGDLEVWRIHPYEHSLIAWRRQPDGSSVEATYTSGAIQPMGLPGVTIDIDALFQ
jgi:Uma2 family endonuclease